MGNDTIAAFGKYDYELVQKLSDRRSLLRSKTSGNEIVSVEYTFGTEDQMLEYMKTNKEALNLSHQFYLNAFDYEILSQSNICSKQYRVVKYFRHQRHTLLEEINNRKLSNKLFEARQVMSILCSCVLVMSHFCKNDNTHYTLNPTDIIIDDQGICKVVSLDLSQYVFDYNQKIGFYYAPETLKMLKHQSPNNSLTNKNAVFTLGVTLLHMILLRQMSFVYNYQNHTINFETLYQQVENVTDPTLSIILKKMLKMHTYERITFTELEEMLFEIIAKQQNNHENGLTPKNDEPQNYQILKLQQSILKIKPKDDHYSSLYDSHTVNIVCSNLQFKPPHSSRLLGVTFELERDREDLPQSDQTIFTQSDPLNLDEHDHSMPIQHQTQPSPYANSQNYIERKYSQGNHLLNVLTDKSNITSSSYKQYGKQSNLNTARTKVQENKYYSNTYPYYVCETLTGGRYQGYKVGGLRHGFGTFYYKEGGKYTGEWIENRMEGRGALYYVNGRIAYEGDWKQDKLDGYGVLYNENVILQTQEFDFQHLQRLDQQWVKYEGNFKEDVKEGQGTIYLSNGEYYRGMFENDLPNGSGVYRNVRGETVRGIWLMGALNAHN